MLRSFSRKLNLELTVIPSSSEVERQTNKDCKTNQKNVLFFLGQTILSFYLLEDKQNFKFGGV